ncbi:MAG: thioredoxin family protein [Proteobacteria bacterium]|nr:thioredoxin family protein [Pseudomonadota bacterium]
MFVNKEFSLFGTAVGLLVVLAAGGVRAEEAASAWAQTDQSEVRLVAAATATGAAKTVRLGLQFRLAPGWKTYWRSPGDAGFPPRVDWTGSRNLARADMRWPAPVRFELFGYETFGYGGEVVLPIEAQLSRPGEALALAAKVDYLVCEKICIPYTAELALELPAGPAAPSAHAHLIDRFNARVPSDGAGLAIEQAAWTGGAAPAIRVVARAMTPFAAPDVIVEGPAGWSFGRATSTFADGGTRAVLRLPARGEGAAGAEPVGAAVVLTLIDGERATERRLILERGGAGDASALRELSAILFVALLGGLILNLMPCVLPVLSIKLLAVARHGGATRTRIRRNFLASAAGVVAAFLVLAGALAALKAGGVAVGWGIQFQQPAFLVFMALLLTLFAANLWGWFDIRLPARLADAALRDRPTSPEHEGLAGAFATGAFATLLATPCSAPFLGSAVGFALARGSVEIFAVFAALGTGMALPYLVVGAWPGLVSRLPRPGRWMAQFKAALGIVLAGTALWLLSVLATQSGAWGASIVGALLAAALFILWIGRHAVARSAWRPLAIAALALVAFVAPGRFAPEPSAAVPPAAVWQPFDQNEIAAMVRAGRVVLVDVTADWCLTCQVNKAVVLSRGAVAERLADGRVAARRADWTRPDEGIARYLAGFGRYGIPFNVVYGPAAPDGIALPELLTTEAVLAALDRAGPARSTAAAQ